LAAYIRFILSIAALLFGYAALAATELNLKSSFVGYSFIDLRSGKVLAEKNPDKLFIPASTQKMFTALAAETVLGMNYEISNDLSYGGKIKAGVLYGDIVITFRGNPFFTKVDIQDMVMSTKAYGIKQIKGKIIIDDSYLDSIKYPHGWAIENKHSAFMAPISAISIDKNSEYVVTKNLGGKANLDYDQRAISVNSKLDFGKCEQEDFELYGDDNNHYKLFGCHKNDEELTHLKIAIQNPHSYAAKLVELAFKNAAIKYEGIVFQGNNNPVQVIKSYTSPKLRRMLQEVMVNSNNHIAEILTKTMGRYRYDSGSWKAGTKTIGEALVTSGIRDCDNYFYDGSGLSKKNLVSPACFVKLLRLLDKKNSEVISTMPKANQGTLNNRFISLPSGYEVRVKSGVLSGVSALVGYIEHNKKRVVAFAMITNNFPEELTKEVKQAEEQLIKEVINKLS
jgi:D-alanyl-D-alanine carboxypeptidase/D-alanyl-D-alanine-endopeptidase (penicillin-binding protein 4)